MQGEVEV